MELPPYRRRGAQARSQTATAELSCGGGGGGGSFSALYVEGKGVGERDAFCADRLSGVN